MSFDNLEQAIESYRNCVAVRLLLPGSWENLRFTVIDTESTGTDVRSDQIISIAGVAVSHGEILVEDSFEQLVPVTHNTSSVMIHGITRSKAGEGLPLDETLARFLGWMLDGVIVGHHIGHDVALLNRVCEQLFHLRLQNVVIDTMELTMALEDRGRLKFSEPLRGFSLDDLCRAFKIVPHDRHTASGDAFLTAQIFLRLLRRARAAGLLSLSGLTARFADK